MQEFINQTQQIIQFHSKSSMGIARSITLFWENKKRRIVEDRKNEEIENHLRKWEREENKNTKILLLGNEGSGKNTLMKQVCVECCYVCSVIMSKELSNFN